MIINKNQYFKKYIKIYYKSKQINNLFTKILNKIKETKLIHKEVSCKWTLGDKIKIIKGN